MSGWQRVFLDDRQVPIMIKGIEFMKIIFSIRIQFFSPIGDEVIGYDDLQSMELKVSKDSIYNLTEIV